MHPRLVQIACPSARKVGFTLVELLTVIAIVGILAAILIPVLGGVRARANTATCQSNLREIGIAMNLYATSNNGYLPPSYKNNGGAWWANTWQWALQPYLEQRKATANSQGLEAAFDGIFHCPSKPNFNIDGPTDVERISYGMNAFSNGATSLSSVTVRKVNSLSRPPITMLVTDTGYGSSSIGNGDIVKSTSNGARWHDGKDNVLFADGHVESLAQGDLNYYLMKTTDNSVRP